jgi:ADP-ribose pyrophosphatase YjhB (NUDIX family)
MPKLQRVVNFEMLSLWGEIDPEITIRFNPLRQVSQAELGAKLKDEADTREKYVNMGAFSPGEVRKIAIEDEDLPFGDLDPDELPPPPAEEGLLSGKGKGGEQGQGGFGAGEGEEDGGEDKSGDYGAGDSSITMDELREEMRTIIREAMALDAVEWKETQHKRDDGGKFTAGGGGGGAGSGKAGEMPGIPTFLQVAQAPKTNIGAPLDLNTLQKVGKQMGSNPGGVYQSADGKQFYVKQGKTPAHVTNELIAGALYHLAGTPTLKYRPVDGGKHIATEMTQLDKNNANKFDEKQRHEAKKDFAVHAWLGNWDAAGTGGDNLGIVRGKPTALDVGGALEFRAQGAPKGKAFGDKVTELGTMRDKHMSPDNAKLFGDMTPAEMRESASFVTSIPDKEIKRTVEKLGGSPELAQKLIARRNDIARQAETFGSDADPASPDSAVVFAKDGKLPVTELNGVPFTPWEAPESTRDWANVEGQADIEEPEFIVPDRKRAGTGVVMREPDGRVWMMRPKNGFGGYQHTFPKGGLERGLSPQANAIKEAYEETGLKAKITGFAGDHEGDTSFTRYYFAEREAGDPSKTTWESDGVVLSPLSKLDGFLNRSRDKKIAASLGQDQALDEAKFEEGKHPRGPDGKFTEGAGGEGGGAGPTRTAAPS